MKKSRFFSFLLLLSTANNEKLCECNHLAPSRKLHTINTIYTFHRKIPAKNFISSQFFYAKMSETLPFQMKANFRANENGCDHQRSKYSKEFHLGNTSNFGRQNLIGHHQTSILPSIQQPKIDHPNYVFNLV